MPDEYELSRRRPDFVGGVPVVMADGREWHVARPLARFGFDAGPGGFAVVLSLDGSDGFAAASAEVDRASDANDGPGMIRAELALAALMLRRNYRLTDAELGAVLQFGYDAEADPEGAAIREAILGVARGDSPKRRGDTSG